MTVANLHLDEAQAEMRQALAMPNGVARDMALMRVGAQNMQAAVEVLINETVGVLARPKDRHPAADFAAKVLLSLRDTVDGLETVTTPIEE